MKQYGILAAALLAAAGALMAHHSIAANFDESKPVTVRGVVMKVEWTNPHVYYWIDTANNGQITHWGAEFDSTLAMKRAGWRRDLVHVGDSVTVQGIRARNGSNTLSGRSLELPGGRKMAAPTGDYKLAPARTGKAAETPRWPDGHPRLGTPPGERGFWGDPSPSGLYDMTAGNIAMNQEGLLANINDAAKVAPFLPWAKALYEYRQRNMLRDDPMAFCLPPGGPRQFQDRYGIQIVEQLERKRVMVLSGGGNRNWRIIDTDGRPLADPEEVTPTYYGYSVGHWEGDTFVVQSTAFTERFWFTNGGLPHTEGLKLTERITRPDHDTLHYEVTVDDPATYSRTWTGAWNLSWVPDADIQEYFCDDNNKETEHLSGKHEVTEP